MTKQELETIIRYDETPDAAVVYTCSRALMRRLEKIAHDRPDECKLIRKGTGAECAEYTVPKKWISIRPTRIISDAERARLRERGRIAARNLHSEPKNVDSYKGSIT